MRYEVIGTMRKMRTGTSDPTTPILVSRIEDLHGRISSLRLELRQERMGNLAWNCSVELP